MATQCLSPLLRARAAMAILAVTGLHSAQPVAADVRGDFDFPLEAVAVTSTAAADVASSELALFEVTIPVSFRMRKGNANDVRQIEVELTLVDDQLQVMDYEPRTSLASDVVGEIEVKTTTEDARNWGGAVGASIPIPGLKGAQIGPSANISDAERTVRTETTRRRPKMATVVVAGNTARGKGAFFQLRPGPDVALEGAHHFTLRISAPRDVRASKLTIKCRAVADEDWILFDRRTEVARSKGEVNIIFASHANPGGEAPLVRAAVARDVEELPEGQTENNPASSDVSAEGPQGSLHHAERPCPWCDVEP